MPSRSLPARRPVDVVTWWRLVLPHLVQHSWHEVVVEVRKRRGLDLEGDAGTAQAQAAKRLQAYVATAEVEGCRVLLLELVVTKEAIPGPWTSAYGAPLLAACQLYGVNLKAIEQQVAVAAQKAGRRKGRGGKGETGPPATAKASRGRPVRTGR